MEGTVRNNNHFLMCWLTGKFKTNTGSKDKHSYLVISEFSTERILWKHMCFKPDVY